MSNLWRFTTLFGALVLAIPGQSAAQETLSSLQGTVRNQSGHPVEQAQVILNPGASMRELRTDRDGRFRFIGVTPGSHRLRILRIGFQPRDTSVDVSGANTEIEVTLERLTTLAQVEVVSRRTGVYGTILGNDSYKPLEGARLELLGGRVKDTTDAQGEFWMQSKDPGTYMLRVSRDGYDTRMVSVRVPKDTGVGIDIVLKPGSPLLDMHMEMLWADMSQRINWKGVNAAFVGREEWRGRGNNLWMALRLSPSSARKGIVIDEQACIFVDGVGRPGMTINDFSADDIESVELYPMGSEYTKNLGTRWPPRGICGNPSATRSKDKNRAASIVIWTRQR